MAFRRRLMRSFLVLLCLAVALAGARAADSIGEARQLYITGKYDEAQEAYAKLAEKDPIGSALGVARCLSEVGKLDRAGETLASASKEHPKVADFPAELARLALARGDYPRAAELAAAAIKLDGKQLAAHWVQAEVFRLTGKLSEADKAHHWFVEFYNDNDVTDPESLRWIGLGAAQFARWNRLSDQFSFLANELYPDALNLDKQYWPAHYELGRLFAEKYNQADASRALKKALEINPRSADVHAALAQLALQGYEISEAQQSVDRALEINPKNLAAHLAQADIHLANFDPQRAVDVLRGALSINPNSEELLGRMAAALMTLDGTGLVDDRSRAGKIIAQADLRNPAAGGFYLALADALDKVRRFPAAARYYQKAIDRMPQLTESRGQLGLMLMRLGDEAPAAKILKESFDVDPFNVRVNNTNKVLEVLTGYETLETAHFIIKFDGEKDKVLARYASRWLEEVYPELCKELGYEPPQKSLFEIFSRARDTDGHGWFSARMVGLPHIHTIGACAGKMVAMQSPTEGQKFNWARVLKHEFVHVLNLQQTDFNIPHWYTEALAVLSEGYPRPQAWTDLLASRLAENKVFTLETINRGFIRPRSSDDWTLAYCQAALYAEYMRERFGRDATSKVLACYAANLSTPDAIRKSFNVALDDFEKGYREFIEKAAAGAKGRAAAAATKTRSLVELAKAVEADPKNAELLAQFAKVQLNRKANAEARRLADEALKIKPKHQLASYVLARLHIAAGEAAKALEVLEGALDREAPQEDLLGLLAGLKLKAEQYPEAAVLYELGAQKFPGDLNWSKSLAAVYLKSGDEKKLATALAKLADADNDDVVTRKKLAALSLTAKTFDAAERYARDALHIDVMDLDVHRMLAEALSGLDKHAAAAEEYETAVELKPGDVKLRFVLAQSYAAAGERRKAREALDAVEVLDPKFPGAKELAEKLK